MVNPMRLQHAPRGQTSRPTPLVLVHDGGGTTFSYFSLGSLGRDVWALHNPKYFTSERWEGGIDEMVKHYIDLIQRAGIHGTILLGGWSFGGYLSMAMAKILAIEPCSPLHVAGILLMDSPFLVCGAKLPHEIPSPDVQLPELVQKCMSNCHEMLYDWELPAWDGAAYGGGQRLRFTLDEGTKTFVVPSGSVMHKPLGAAWALVKTGSFKGPSKVQSQQEEAADRRAMPPPGVLVRSVEHAPCKGNNNGSPCRIDVFRDETLLGWDSKHVAFITAVIDAPSHHYNLFSQANIAHLTQSVNNALEILTTVTPVVYNQPTGP